MHNKELSWTAHAQKCVKVVCVSCVHTIYLGQSWTTILLPSTSRKTGSHIYRRIGFTASAAITRAA